MTQDATAELFGPYELRSLLGRGGMGEVFRAYDTVRKRTVALKRLPRHLASDTDFQARFRREAEIAARLTEPHIIPIHDYGEIEGQLYIDMRLIVGADLAEVLAKEGPLSPARAVGIVGQVASALAAAHAEGLVHRDVKPSNVLISVNDRGEDFVHLVDFGIARDENATGLTATGTAVGTIDYMAPERIERGECDYRVDVYALGCVLYEALTATKAFPAAGSAAKMFAHVYTPPPRPSQSRPTTPPALDEVVAVAMAKAPTDRYRTVGELATSALRALDGRPVTQTRGPATTGPPPSTRFPAPPFPNAQATGQHTPPPTRAAGPAWTAAGPSQAASTRVALPGNPGATTVRGPGGPPPRAPQQGARPAPQPPPRSRRTLYLVLAAVLVLGGLGAVALLNQPGAGSLTGIGTGAGAGTPSAAAGTPPSTSRRSRERPARPHRGHDDGDRPVRQHDAAADRLPRGLRLRRSDAHDRPAGPDAADQPDRGHRTRGAGVRGDDLADQRADGAGPDGRRLPGVGHQQRGHVREVAGGAAVGRDRPLIPAG